MDEQWCCKPNKHLCFTVNISNFLCSYHKIKEEKLREEARYSLDPVVQLAEGFKKEKKSLMDSAGYYYLTAETLEDIHEAL